MLVSREKLSGYKIALKNTLKLKRHLKGYHRETEVMSKLR